MVIPPSLIVVIALLIIAFLSSLVGAARARARETKYLKVAYVANSKSDGTSSSPPSAGVETYQQPAQDHYALPAKKKEVTYCVIDGRLVDS